MILRSFWPSTAPEQTEGIPSFSDVQFGLGDARYLVAQISPFSFSWRCDVYANLLAYLMNLVDRERAMMTFRFLWGVGVNEPWPVKNLYPPVQAGDPEWRDYFTVNLLNLPNHYHNGGIWPFIGGLWVRYIHKLGMTGLARRELVKLARLCSQGVTRRVGVQRVAPRRDGPADGQGLPGLVGRQLPPGLPRPPSRSPVVRGQGGSDPPCREQRFQRAQPTRNPRPCPTLRESIRRKRHHPNQPAASLAQ